jgi:protein-L-isoaspartate(D-aspartate) O-methyltransferase
MSSKPFQQEKKVLQQELEDAKISPSIIKVMVKTVSRENFVPKQDNKTPHPKSYANHPLRIGFQQTISQPFIVAYMLMLLQIEGDVPLKILEIGTGLGYNAAVMAKLSPKSKVYSLEIVEDLCRKAQRFFTKHHKKYPNVVVKCGDGFLGWRPFEPNASFDRIIITASTRRNQLKHLLRQLKKGGILVVPLESTSHKFTSHKFTSHTYLYVFQKDKDGHITKKKDIGVRFVPFTGKSRSS